MKLILIFFIPLTKTLAICPKGWIDATDFDMGCLHFNGTLPMAWDESQDFCKSLNSNSHLVEIMNEVQQNLLTLQGLPNY